MSAEDPGPDVRAVAAEAFPRAAASAFKGLLAFRGEQEQDGSARYILADAGGDRITVRVEVTPLPGGSLARLHANTHSGNHVIQLSSRTDPLAAGALLAAQLHELRAIRDSAARAAEARPLDLLVPGPGLPLSPRLTAADKEHLNSLNRAARDMNDPSRGTAEPEEARARFSFLLDDLGLRPAGRGTGDAPAVRVRQAIAAAELSPLAAAALRDLGRPASQLPAADAAALRQQRAAARGHDGPAVRSRGVAPGLGPRWRDLPDLALAAQQARAARSHATLGWLRDQQARLAAGRHPRMPVMIGGGAALAGRDPRMLVIDARQGWHVATLWALGQTTDQLGPMAATGFGNPHDFALGQQRVPLDALRYWEDQAAACGPVINGSAFLHPGGNGALLVEIRPGDGSPPVTIEAAGIPVIATGFPPERVPGYALPVPTLPAAAQVLGRHHPDAWPEIAGALEQAAPGQALAAWLSQAGRPLPGPRPDLLAPAAQTVNATAAWEAARLQAPRLVMTGDDLSHGRGSPLAARRWLIAGTGGLAYTSAEIILDANPDADVVMVGIGAREPVRNTPQYTRVTYAHVAAEGGDGRLTVVDGQPLLGQVETAQKAGRAVFRVRGCEGDACVACLGRAGILPAAVAPLAGWAHGKGGRVDGELMYDDCRQYLGYRLTFTAAGARYEAEITGAASRVLPTELFPPAILRRAAREWLHEIPPESGNVPGGFLATAMQAHRYASARSRAAWMEM